MAAPMCCLKQCTENIGIMNKLMTNIQNAFMLASPNKPWVDENCKKHFVRRNQTRNNSIVHQSPMTRCDLYIPCGVLRAAGFDGGVNAGGVGLGTRHNLDSKIGTCKDQFQGNVQLSSMISSIQEESQKWVVPIRSSWIGPSGSLNISICRQQAFQKVLQMVREQGDGYCCKMSNTNQEVLLHSDVAQHEYDLGLTLTQLRALLLCNHLERMLKSVKHNVHLLRQPMNEACWIDAAFAIKPKEYKPQSLQQLTNQLHDSLAESKYRVPTEQDVGNPQASWIQHVLLDVSSFVEEQRKIGKKYSKNIKSIPVNRMETGESLLQDLSMVESCVDSLEGNIVVLHVTSHDKEYRQQCLDVLCQIGSRHASRCRHIHLVHGQVHIQSDGTPGGGNMQMSARSFFDLRSKQMRMASEIKHGDTVKGKLWDARITNLTSAAMTFELLGSTPQNTIKLELGEETDGQNSESRDGVFVMYNYARLATLFKKFEKRVAEGYYPTLANIEDVDLGLLREEAEWQLLFQYILPYQDLITQLLQPIFYSTGPRVQLQMHKICAFLVNLSQDLSAYYSRTHVLSEPRTHLLPVMFARLHLLKAVQQVMYSALKHLNIEPLEEM